MDMVAGYTPSDNLSLIFLTDLPYEIPNPDGDASREDRIAVFRDPDDMIRAVKGRMARFPIVLHTSAILSC